jgi:hypothetical protein
MTLLQQLKRKEQVESDSHPRYVDAYTIRAEPLVGCRPSYEQKSYKNNSCSLSYLNPKSRFSDENYLLSEPSNKYKKLSSILK